MLRKTLLALGVAALLGLSWRSAAPVQAAPTYFTIAQSCPINGVGVDVTVSWQGTSSSALGTWIDLSEYNNFWAPDTFATSGQMSPNITSFKWVSLLPFTTYYVRVSQNMGPGFWDTSLTYMFQTGPACGMGAPGYPAHGVPAYGMPGYGMFGYGIPSYGMPAYSTYSGGSSYSVQPIDYFVQQARLAYYLPPRQPILVNYYPFTGMQPYLGSGMNGGGTNPGGGGNCDPSYPTICIPSPPPTLNCPDVLPYTDFPVVGADPHNFDADNDGIGCET